MALKGVDSLVKQTGKKHAIEVIRNRGKYYFKSFIPPLNEFKNWRLLGHIPAIKPWRNGYHIGRCVSCRNEKTATIICETGKWKPLLYHNTKWGFRQHTKYQIHDEYQICNPGDIVMFAQANPKFSKTKAHGLVEVIRSAPLWEDYPSWEGTTGNDFNITSNDDPDRDDIFDETQRLTKAAQEMKMKDYELKRKYDDIEEKDTNMKRKLAKINNLKIHSWKDQISRYGV
mmetsp:Transcript_35531/g.43901  ORF Transcript_35531/g.43901 Transcript_35531/m.43901 type:complete len:229 (+) Transcript_35531:64-750(+)